MWMAVLAFLVGVAVIGVNREVGKQREALNRLIEVNNQHADLIDAQHNALRNMEHRLDTETGCSCVGTMRHGEVK